MVSTLLLYVGITISMVVALAMFVMAGYHFVQYQNERRARRRRSMWWFAGPLLGGILFLVLGGTFLFAVYNTPAWERREKRNMRNTNEYERERNRKWEESAKAIEATEDLREQCKKLEETNNYVEGTECKNLTDEKLLLERIKGLRDAGLRVDPVNKPIPRDIVTMTKEQKKKYGDCTHYESKYYRNGRSNKEIQKYCEDKVLGPRTVVSFDVSPLEHTSNVPSAENQTASSSVQGTKIPTVHRDSVNDLITFGRLTKPNPQGNILERRRNTNYKEAMRVRSDCIKKMQALPDYEKGDAIRKCYEEAGQRPLNSMEQYNRRLTLPSTHGQSTPGPSSITPAYDATYMPPSVPAMGQR